LQREPEGQFSQMTHIWLFASLLDVFQSFHHGPGICTAMSLCQVPQVDGELVESVVAEVSMCQDTIKEGKAQGALALQSLKQEREITIWPWGPGWSQVDASSATDLLQGKLLNLPSPTFSCRRVR